MDDHFTGSNLPSIFLRLEVAPFSTRPGVHRPMVGVCWISEEDGFANGLPDFACIKVVLPSTFVISVGRAPDKDGRGANMLPWLGSLVQPPMSGLPLLVLLYRWIMMDHGS